LTDLNSGSFIIISFLFIYSDTILYSDWFLFRLEMRLFRQQINWFQFSLFLFITLTFCNVTMLCYVVRSCI